MRLPFDRQSAMAHSGRTVPEFNRSSLFARPAAAERVTLNAADFTCALNSVNRLESDTSRHLWLKPCLRWFNWPTVVFIIYWHRPRSQTGPPPDISSPVELTPLLSRSRKATTSRRSPSSVPCTS